MYKTVRVKEDTYGEIMNIAGSMQLQRKRKVSADEAIKFAIKDRWQKDPQAWEKLDKLMFKGPKANCTEDIDKVL